MIKHFAILLLLLLSRFPLVNVEVVSVLSGIFFIALDFTYVEKLPSLFRKSKRIIFFLFCLIVVFFLHYIIFEAFSFVAVINFFLRIYIAFSCYRILEGSFVKLYSDYIFFFAILSIFFFIFSGFLNFKFGLSSGRHLNLLIYNILPSHPDRNCGPFYEPGIFAIHIVMVMFLSNIYSLRKSVWWYLILVIVVLSTKSTTGYILLLIYFLYVILTHRSRFKFVLLAVLLSSFTLAWFNLPFLEDKSQAELESAVSDNGHGISWSRTGSAILDFEYIKESPLFGNGLSLQSRYRNHITHGNVDLFTGFGNGLTGFISSMGLIIFFL